MAKNSEAFESVANLNARLANLKSDNGYALGLEVDGGVLDVTAAANALNLPAPKDIDDLLQNDLGEQVAAIRDAVAKSPRAGSVTPLEQVKFAPLVTRPEKIVCVGFNYLKHAIETGTKVKDAPPLFGKFKNALNHHGGTVTLPVKVDTRFDYETELVIVFGKRCRDVSLDDALDCVAGYTIANDVSARFLQTQTEQLTAGKISDGFLPLGPWLTTRDRIPDPNKLKLQTHWNGKEVQNWSTDDMLFDCRHLIHFLSGILTIEPGDILLTGTPQGVILGQKIPAVLRHWIKPGDEVVSTIEGLGELKVQYA